MNFRALCEPRHYHLLWHTLKEIPYIGFAEFCRRGWRYLKAISKDEAVLPAIDQGLEWFLDSPIMIGPLSKPVDIIMPIYNGYSYVFKAVTSVLRNTEGPYQLWLCDDGSEDPRVRDYLNDIAGRFPHVHLLRSECNRGFLATVNAAMPHVQNHFVLLNQDTEVPPNWLPRLLAPLLDDPDKVASVTPMSNAAGICSFPKFLEDNPLYSGLDVPTLDSFFQRIKPNGVKTPTGVGFCMAFNRDVVSRIGLFDPVFGTGYGEENDWCQRALSLGYQHLIVPNLFVYHKHGAVFGERKAARLVETERLLYQRHRHYPRRIDAFLRADPLGPFRKLLPLIIRANLAKECALWIDHSLGGGANAFSGHCKQQQINSGQGVLTLTCKPGQRPFLIEYQDREEKFAYRLEDLESLKRLATHIPLRQIHVNTLAGFPDPLALLEGIGSLHCAGNSQLHYYLHDYFPLCPRYTLLDWRDKFCELPPASVCQVCLGKSDGIYTIHMEKPVSDISAWRARWKLFLKNCDRITVFSKCSGQLLESLFPDVSDRIQLRPHRVPPINVKLPCRTAAIGVLGKVSSAKGLGVLRDMGDIIRRRGSRLRIVVIGEAMGKLDPHVFTVTGRYRKEQLPSLVEQHRLALFLIPSIWPETFCYTVAEVMAMNAYLAVFDLGAQAERVKEYSRGKVLSEMSAEKALEEIVAWGKSLGIWDEQILGTDPLQGHR